MSGLSPSNHMTWQEYQEYLASKGLAGRPTPAVSARPGKTKAEKAGWVAKASWHQSPIVGLIYCRSKKEARRAAELDLMVAAGELTAWWHEVPLACGFDNDDGRPVRMFPDFKLLRPSGRITYQDTKPDGRKPEKDWTLRRKAVRSHLGIEVEIL